MPTAAELSMAVAPTAAKRSSMPKSTLRTFLVLNALALVLAAVYFRCHALGNVPGANGDEAWHGVRAWQLLHGGAEDWNTPTGNPLNPLFVGPLALLHPWFPPSIWLLRAAAVAGGLAALAINWSLCRWAFDRPTAAVSTVMLAVLPINIAYSRFAWDASQSLAATLPVVYFSLAAVRSPARFGRWISAAVLTLAVALWVHPTNVFVGCAILAAVAVRVATRSERLGVGMVADRPDAIHLPRRRLRAPHIMLIAAGAALAAWASLADLQGDGPAESRLAGRLRRVRESAETAPPAAILYPRLFTGETVYRYVAGSRSWLAAGGIGVGLFWAGMAGAGWLIWSNRRDRRSRIDDLRDRRSRLYESNCDLALLASWALTVAALAVIAGRGAMAPGQERFALCLIAPTVLLAARGATTAWQAASPGWRVVLAAATLAGWPLLADFHAHYFRFIEQTGGRAHMTFRTAAVEPKRAALQYILAESAGRKREKTAAGDVWIVSSQWWIRQPIRYLALVEPDVRVPSPAEVRESEYYRRALGEGRVWFAEFCGTGALRRVEERLAGRHPTRQVFLDYARRPVICVLHSGNRYDR